MQILIQDFLDYSQIKQGKFRKNLVEFDLKESVEKVMSVQKQWAEEKGIDLKLEYLAEKKIIKCDESRVK